VNPPTVHPIVNCGPAYCGHPNGRAYRQKIRFLLTCSAETSGDYHNAPSPVDGCCTVATFAAHALPP